MRLALGLALLLAAGPEPLSDAFKVTRPAGGEYFGVYLLSKKVGYLFTDLALEPERSGKPRTARATSELHFKANVGSGVSERHHREVRLYEAKPEGRLLSFTVEQKGDGGEQTLTGTASATGVEVKVQRPGQPPRTVVLPPTQERVEDADAPRVALFRNATVTGQVIDAQELATFKVTTTVGETETQTLRGVPVTLRSTTTISDKEKVPIKAFIGDAGEVVELGFGEMMKARAESPAVAQRLDQVEVFGLTRVKVPKVLPDSVHDIPGQVKWLLTGLPSSFQRDTSRQKFRPIGDPKEGKVEVTLTAAPPVTSGAKVPIKDPEGGANLKPSIVVESDHPEVKALARKIAGGEKDAYALAKKVSAWVGTHLRKSYGTSADRASEVLHQMKGDCTEHSLLTVALLRSLGVPAKRIDGLVYLVNEDRVPALYWHEWVAAYVGEWTQLDPTFGQPVADATHFGLGEEGSAEITPLIGQLKVLEAR